MVAEYFREGEEPIFGLGALVDGGFAMGENLPLFAYGEGEGGGCGTTVTTSDGKTKVVPKKADFGTRLLRRALLTACHACRGRALAGARPSRYHRAPKLDRTRPMRAETQDNVEAIRKVAEASGPADGLGNRAAPAGGIRRA